jgi:hypothetical protein
MASFMAGKQLGFGDYEQTTARKRTKRERFLGQKQAVSCALEGVDRSD